MKKNTTLGFKIAIALVALFTTALYSCKDPEPKPNPPINNEDPKKPDKPDNPDQPDNPDDPQKGDFKEWLVFDEAGNLATVPIPFADFTKGATEVKAWEKEYGSTLYKETTDKGVTSLFFDTNDPKKLNEKRFYSLKDGKLQASIYSIASKLIFEPTLTKNVPNDAFELLLAKEGYTASPQQPKDGVSYTNGKYNLIYSYNSTNKELTLAMVMPAVKGAGEYKFHANVKDLPLLMKGKYVKDYTEKEIKAYEEKLGRLYSDKLSKTDQQLTFLADASIQTNFQKVVYDRKDGQNSDGTPRSAQILATSLSIPSVTLLKTPDAEKYLREQGFEFEKEIAFGGTSALIYNAKSLGFKLTVANVDDKSTMWVFDKYALVGGEDPNPQEGRKAYYLPFYLWDAPIAEGSPIMEKEKARGFEVKFTAAEEETADNPLPRPAEITARVPFDRDYASSDPKKLGMVSFTYSIDKYAKDPSKNVKVDMLLNYMGASKELQKKGKLEFCEFIQGEGFQLESGTTADDLMIFYNAKDKVQVQVSSMFNSVMVEFKYRAN